MAMSKKLNELEFFTQDFSEEELKQFTALQKKIVEQRERKEILDILTTTGITEEQAEELEKVPVSERWQAAQRMMQGGER